MSAEQSSAFSVLMAFGLEPTVRSTSGSHFRRRPRNTMEAQAIDEIGNAGAQPPARQRRPSVLPANLPPRLLTREEAAEYMRISPRLFDRAVADKMVPKGG